MRISKPLLSLLSLLFICGCASKCEMRFQKGTGDAGEFIFRRSIEYGGKPTDSKDSPLTGCSWSYSEDDHGTIVRMSRDSYPKVEAMLLQSFGKPAFGPAEATDGEGKVGCIRFEPLGGGIQFSSDKKWTLVIILKPRR